MSDGTKVVGLSMFATQFVDAASELFHAGAYLVAACAFALGLIGFRLAFGVLERRPAT